MFGEIEKLGREEFRNYGDRNLKGDRKRMRARERQRVREGKARKRPRD